MSAEIGCLESSHHSTVIETESLDLYGSYFVKKEWLKGREKEQNGTRMDGQNVTMNALLIE